MELIVVADERRFALSIPPLVLKEGEEFFKKMELDLNRGWQIGRDWVERPDILQRCQIAADRLVTAMNNDQHMLAQLLAGYILARLPHVREVHVNTEGEPQETAFIPPATP